MKILFVLLTFIYLGPAAGSDLNANLGVLSNTPVNFGVELKMRGPIETVVQPQCTGMTDMMEACLIDDSALNFVSSLMLNVEPVSELPEGKCACERRIISNTVGNLAEKENAEKAELLRNVRNSLNKKILNDYALHLEDFKFYESKAANVFDSTSARKFAQLRCATPSRFEDAVNNNSKCSGISAEEKERRKNDLLGAFGSRLDGTFPQRLSQISDLINSGSERRNRRRFSVSRNDAAVRFVNNFYTKLFNRREFRDYFENIVDKIDSEGLSPSAAMAKVFNDELNSTDPGRKSKLANFLGRDIMGDDYANAQALINDGTGDRDKLLRYFQHIFKNASLLHPGFDRLMNDGNLFKATQKVVKRGGSVRSALEESDVIPEMFEENCDKIMQDFSNVICSSDEDLISKISTNDLNAIVANSRGNEHSKMIQGLIACERGASGSEAEFQNLLINSSKRRPSDFYDREMNPKDEQVNIDSVIESLPPERKRLVDELESLWSDSGTSITFDDSGRRIISTNSAPNATVNNESSNARNSSPVNEVGNIDSIYNTQTEAQMNQGGNLYNTGAYTPPVSAQVNNNSNSSSESFDPRRELREFLKEREDQENVDNLLSNTNDDMMKSLLELKKEMERNEKRILELTAENERLKLESMRKRMENLQREREALEPGEVRNRTESSFVRREGPVGTSLPGRNIAPVTPVETGGSNSGTSSIASTSASSEGASLSGLNRALLSSASSSARGPASESSVNPVIVSSSTARSGSLEIRSQEVGLDLLNYLSSKGTDLQTLINLKTSGMIYKYKVMENGQVVEKEVLIEYSNLNEDVKKIIDKKIAQNQNRSNELVRLDNEIKELQRVYSYSALQMILAEQMRNKAE